MTAPEKPPYGHPLHFIPKKMWDQPVRIDDLTSSLVSPIVEMLEAQAEELAKGAVAKELEYIKFAHVSPFMQFLSHIRKNFDKPEERSKILYTLDKFLNDSYWKRYNDWLDFHNRMEKLK